MQKLHRSIIALLLLSLISCGSSSDKPDFAGTWDGNFIALDNNCPFVAAPSPGQLFPMTVNIDPSNVYTVTAVNGDVATGGQGIGETISFLALSDKFGNFSSTAPYVCTFNPTPYTVGYLDTGDNAAIVNVYLIYQSCSSDGGASNTSSCTVRYTYEATKR